MRVGALALWLCASLVGSCTIAILNDASVTSVTLPLLLRNFSGCPSTSVLNITIVGVNLPAISDSTFAGLTTLKSLKLSNSGLAVISPSLLQNLSSLTHLSLSNNLLTSLPANFIDGNGNLTTVRLNNNNLTTIAPNAFCCGAPVATLDLGFNSLTGFEPGTFSGLTALSTVYWNNNSLLPQNIHTGLLAMAPITTADVSGNINLTSLPINIFNGGGLPLTMSLTKDPQLSCNCLDLVNCAVCRTGVLGCCYPFTKATSSPTTSLPTTAYPTNTPTTASPSTLSPTQSPATTLSPSTWSPTSGTPTTLVPTLIIEVATDGGQAPIPVWVWILIAVVVLALGVGVAVFYTLRKKHMKRRAFVATANSDSSSSGFRSESPSHSTTTGSEDCTLSRSGTLGPCTPLVRDPSGRATATMLEIDGKELEIGAKLGNGAFGSVNQCLWRGTDYAMKSLLKPSQEAAFEKEVEVNRQLSAMPHIHVTRMVGVARNPTGIIMELYPMGSVEDFLRKNLLQSDDFANVLTILITASAGVMHLHSQGIVHRDIAARNFLVKKDFSAAVCDFGLSVAIPEGKTFGTRTAQERETDLLPINITSPEALSLGQYSAASDVFMFGMLIWEVLTRQVPHGNRYEFSANPKDFVGFIQRVIHEHLRPPIPEDWPAALRVLVAQCWEKKPELRPTLSQINHTLRKVRAEVTANAVPLPAVNAVGKSDVKAEPVADPTLYYSHIYGNNKEDVQGPLYAQKEPDSPGVLYQPYNHVPMDV